MNMCVGELSERAGFAFAAGENGRGHTATGAYICDLLSWAMSGVSEGDAWVTVQGHINVVAVAQLTGAACVILAEGAALDGDAAEKANAMGVPILTAAQSAYEIAKILAGFEAR